MFAANEKFSGLTKSQLRRRLIAVFLLLLIPSAFLIYKAMTQLKWETFHQNRQLAEEFSNRINLNLSHLIENEEKRTFTDYSFLNVAGDDSSNVLSRSPLSNFPVNSPIPGLLGYFQIDSDGKFSTTLLPDITSDTAAVYGIPEDEYLHRNVLQQRLFQILDNNRLVQNLPAAPVDSIGIVKTKENSILRDQAEVETRQQSVLESEQQSELKSILEQDSVAIEKRQNQAKLIARNLVSTENETVKDNFSSVSSIEENFNKNVGEKNGSVAFKEAEQQTPAISALYSEPTPRAKPQSQRAFDKLKQLQKSPASRSKIALGRVDELTLDEDLATTSKIKVEVLAQQQSFADEKKRTDKKSARKRSFANLNKTENNKKFTVSGSRIRRETNLLPEKKLQKISGKLDKEVAVDPGYQVQMFQSEIELFEISLLENGYFILFRKVWREGDRYIQGALIEVKPFFDELVETEFNHTALAQLANLTVAYDKDVMALYASPIYSGLLASSRDVKGLLLYQNRFSAPFSELEFIFSIEEVELASGDSLVVWISLVIVVVLCMGFYFIYQLGLKQIELLSQQQDFVSSVSHELKTPLTSIRMYGEMLREGWVKETKKREYYDYIHNESERLSRLINNVLQLSKLSRDDLQIHPQSYLISELLDHIRSKITSQVEAAGFNLKLETAASFETEKLMLDMDAFTQIIINLVDNAIKFSVKQQQQQIDIGCSLRGNNRIQFTVRDYGKGIDKTQMKNIFKLFYRVENELTRETMGTGIGLALVNRLVLAMHGEVDVVNTSPGAEFRISFPLAIQFQFKIPLVD